MTDCQKENVRKLQWVIRIDDFRNTLRDLNFAGGLYERTLETLMKNYYTFCTCHSGGPITGLNKFNALIPPYLVYCSPAWSNVGKGLSDSFNSSIT